MSRHARKVTIPRSLCSIVGAAAVLTATLGAVAVGSERQSANATEPAGWTATSDTYDLLTVEAARRDAFVRASRSYDRVSRSDAGAVTSVTRPTPSPEEARRRQAERQAERVAALRESSLVRLASAAERRSAQIKRQRRLERQRERRRERAARQRRYERLHSWVAPVSNYRITATFGAGGSLWAADHTGLDFAASEGTPVGSVAAGRVTFTGYDGAYGNKVVVTHVDGTDTWYCHLSSIAVGSGQSVGAGQTIGAVGSTGNTTGPHLHLEVRPGGGNPVDPYSFLQSKGAL